MNDEVSCYVLYQNGSRLRNVLYMLPLLSRRSLLTEQIVPQIVCSPWQRQIPFINNFKCSPGLQPINSFIHSFIKEFVPYTFLITAWYFFTTDTWCFLCLEQGERPNLDHYIIILLSIIKLWNQWKIFCLNIFSPPFTQIFFPSISGILDIHIQFFRDSLLAKDWSTLLSL